jgi:hypothetical protein
MEEAASKRNTSDIFDVILCLTNRKQHPRILEEAIDLSCTTQVAIVHKK